MLYKEFDEQDAVRFIRKSVGDEIGKKYSANDLLLLIDTVFEYFERFDTDEDADFDLDVAALVEYVKKQLKRDKLNPIVPEDVEPLVKAEIDYEASLEINE